MGNANSYDCVDCYLRGATRYIKRQMWREAMLELQLALGYANRCNDIRKGRIFIALNIARIMARRKVR